jgi:TonB family protein
MAMLVDDFVARPIEDHHLLEQPSPRVGLVGTLVVHGLLLVAAIYFPGYTPPPRQAPELTARMPRVTPLVAPPVQMTQRAANTGKPSLEVNLEGLLSKPSIATPPPVRTGVTRPAAPKPFEAPPTTNAARAPKPEIEAPQIEEQPRDWSQLQARNLPAIGSIGAPAPPPKIEPAERPKIAFEKPGADMGAATGTGVARARIPAPQPSTVEAATRQVARGGGGGLVVGDIGEGIGGLGDSLSMPNAPPRNLSSLELLSDPMGVDFKPYLIRILSSVKRNWMAVMPESARLGRRGKVQIQFAINRDGSVPKLVIAMPSGTEAFDRAAVAGISASNPFPPLPDEFKGAQVRLQFTFLYNIPNR